MKRLRVLYILITSTTFITIIFFCSMNAYQKCKQQEVKMERLKERRAKLCELLQAERDQLEVNKFITNYTSLL